MGLRKQLFGSRKAAGGDGLPERCPCRFFINSFEISGVKPDVGCHLFVIFDKVKGLADIVFCLFYIILRGRLRSQGEPCQFAEQMIAEACHIKGILSSFKLVIKAQHVPAQAAGVGKYKGMVEGHKHAAESKGMIEHIEQPRKSGRPFLGVGGQGKTEYGTRALVIEAYFVGNGGIQ